MMESNEQKLNHLIILVAMTCFHLGDTFYPVWTHTQVHNTDFFIFFIIENCLLWKYSAIYKIDYIDLYNMIVIEGFV